MLRSTLVLQDNIDISKFPKLIAFLKQKAVGYRPKKSITLSKPDIIKFIGEAPDNDFLMMKVVCIVGVAGACRKDEIFKMMLDNIVDNGSFLVLNIPDTKTHMPRTFTVTSGVDIFRKYVSLRPKYTPHRRLFVFYRKGKCTCQPIGTNTIGKIPSKIAEYLKLPNAAQYTGHCFRRSSATLLANAGSDILNLKRHGGWRSSAVAEGYIEDSIQNKIDISKTITGELFGPVQQEPNLLSHENVVVGITTEKNEQDDVDIVINPPTFSSVSNSLFKTNLPGVNFNNCSSCTFNITVNNKI